MNSKRRTRLTSSSLCPESECLEIASLQEVQDGYANMDRWLSMLSLEALECMSRYHDEAVNNLYNDNFQKEPFRYLALRFYKAQRDAEGSLQWFFFISIGLSEYAMAELFCRYEWAVKTAPLKFDRGGPKIQITDAGRLALERHQILGPSSYFHRKFAECHGR